MSRTVLLNAATAISAGAPFPGGTGNSTYQASVRGSGAVSANINIEASDDGENFMLLATISLSGTTSATDGFISIAAWASVRANLTAIAGTNAAVTVITSSPGV